MIHMIHTSDLAWRMGWTLLHSLWQVLAVAALVGTVLAASARRSANFRYCVACCGLVAMSLPIVATFVCIPMQPESHQLSVNRAAVGFADGDGKVDSSFESATNDARSASSGAMKSADNLSESGPVSANVANPTGGTSSSQPTEAVAVWIPWSIAGWFLGVCLIGFWNLTGWLVVRRMRRLATVPAATRAHESLRRLSGRMKLSRPVRLLESLLVDAPVVIGWLRPVVLFPLSLTTTLSASELDAILAHELAHIRRHDYLVNLFQTLAETLLFYHPAVWWLSRRIRVEREYCCDDAAIAVCGDRVGYASTLAAVERGRGIPVSAMSFLGVKKNMTLDRVRRILQDPAGVRHNWLAGVCALLLVVVVFSGALYSQSRTAKSPKPVETPAVGSIGQPKTPAETASAKPTNRLKQIDLKRFRLDLRYRGPSDKPYYNLTLTVPAAKTESTPFSRVERISEAEARLILKHLSASGFFKHARQVVNRDVGSGPQYSLEIQSGKLRLRESLGWNLGTLRRLDGLQRSLGGTAGKSMTLLIDRLAGHRRIWSSGKVVNGLQTRVTAKRTIFGAGRPIPIRVEVTNVGKQARQYFDPRIDYVGLSITDEKGRSAPHLLGPSQLPQGPKVIEPGKTHLLASLDLATRYYLRRPGRYIVRLPKMELPASNELLVIVKPDPAGTKDGDPIGRLLPLLPRKWTLSAKPGAKGKLQPGSNRHAVTGARYVFIHTPTGSKRDMAIIWLWLTDQAAKEILPPKPPVPGPPASDYLGKFGRWHAYINVSKKAQNGWPTFQQDVQTALKAKR